MRSALLKQSNQSLFSGRDVQAPSGRREEMCDNFNTTFVQLVLKNTQLEIFNHSRADGARALNAFSAAAFFFYLNCPRGQND